LAAIGLLKGGLGPANNGNGSANGRGALAIENGDEDEDDEDDDDDDDEDDEIEYSSSSTRTSSNMASSSSSSNRGNFKGKTGKKNLSRKISMAEINSANLGTSTNRKDLPCSNSNETCDLTNSESYLTTKHVI
jgi:hypothetical protein